MEKKMIWKENYLLIPIQAEKEVKKLELFFNGKKRMEFQIPCGTAEQGSYLNDYYADLPHKLLYQTEQRFDIKQGLAITEFEEDKTVQEEEILLVGDFPKEFFEAIKQSNQLQKVLQKRPGIHFTVNTGWINDPNGLVYNNGEYHLYFQYNPFNTEWENMSWGHAVSKNLLEWKQLDTVLIPDDTGTMFSGCALRNEREVLGLTKDTLLYFYTCAGSANAWSEGKSFTQYLAYSKDNGRTLIKQKSPVLDTIKKENRDPKVFWHKESNCYYMVLWLEGNEFAILKSDSLDEFIITQTFMIPECWECPDLFELQVKESQEKKWIFWSADGYYVICDFKDGKISNFSERKLAYQSKLPYAAQTISGLEGRVVTIPWLRVKLPSRLYTGAMGIPMELSLIKKDKEYVLCQKPVKEYEEAKRFLGKIEVKEESADFIFNQELFPALAQQQNAAYEIQLKLIKESMTEVTVGTKKFQVNELYKGLRIIIDDVIVELQSEDGTYYLAEELEEFSKLEIKVHAEHGIKEAVIYQIDL